MITIEKSFDGTFATVTGDRAEMAIFFCIWQTELWPNWVQAVSTKSGSFAQMKTAIREIRDRGVLILHDNSKQFEDALSNAIARCSLLCIDVSR